MSEQRMSGHDRRAAIVKAVLPVFARQGFGDTTSRDLAQAAGVSEALIYKHFPSKESLYAEIQNFGCQGADLAFEKIERLQPSSSSLVYVVYFLMRSLAIGKSKDLVGWETRHRLVLHSCLEDGAFPRFLFNNHFAACFEKIVACLAAAEAAGELVRSPVFRQNRVLFAQHLACMIAIMHLPEKPVMDYQVPKEEILNQAFWFVLRGMGLTDEAIAAHYNPKTLSSFFSQNAA